MLMLTHTCALSRNTALGTNGRRQMQPLATGVSTLAMPMSAPTAVQNGFELGRGYDFFFDMGTDVKVNDKITWNGSDYTVTACIPYQTPLVEHIHVMAKQELA